MSNTWRVFTRDARRLLGVRKAWIIVIGVIVTPALYAWFNIVGFWDPYGSTSNIDVAVVNLDTGAHSDMTGDIDVGAQVVAQLKANDQLGWRFVDRDEALERVRSGESYAAIIIPASFSADLVSITTGDFTQPTLQYFVNEKANAVAPKVTDVGASTIEAQITSTFTSMVAEAATDALVDAGQEAEQQLTDARGATLNALDEAVGTVADAHESVAGLKDGLAGPRESLAAARSTLDDVDRALVQVQSALAQGQSIVADAQRDVVALTDSVSSAYVQGATVLADASAVATPAITDLTSALTQANRRLASAIESISAVVEANGAAIADLQVVVADADLDPDVAARLDELIAALQDRNTRDQELLGSLRQLAEDTATTATGVGDAAEAIDAALGTAAGTASSMRTILLDTVPALNGSMSALSTSTATLSATITAQRTQLVQAQDLLDDLDAQIVATGGSLDALASGLDTVQSNLQTLRTDVLALGTAASWTELNTLSGLDAQQIAQFMASPVQVQEHVVFKITSYGSAMAALFTNLSLWIGAFMLMVIFRLEVDREGIPGVTVRQAYLGRWLLLACVAATQGLLVCLGNLVIGVQTANAVAFVGTGVLISLAYLSIVYALSVSFGHIGKGLCVVLVIMQIPGASGLYPIEMMPGFFRALYPLFPFTYGIDAMRETISGFYGTHYLRYVGALAVFVALSFALGLVLRRYLGNLHGLFNREIASTGLLRSEEVQITGGGYRLSQVIHALSDREEYRDGLERRAARFTRRYPRLRYGALAVGGAGMAVLGVLSWLTPGVKASLLGIWVAWVLAVMGFLLAVEYLRYNLALAADLGQMPESQLRQVMLEDDHGAHAASAHAAEPGPRHLAQDKPTPAPDDGADPQATAPDDGADPQATAPDDGSSSAVDQLELLLAAQSAESAENAEAAETSDGTGTGTDTDTDIHTDADGAP
ncbi:MAG: YhgE/Pip family protein [Cellulomonadaceae bacterium]